MNGVVVVDKPRGITSFDVVARVRRATGTRRVGHSGTLDPMATGVLPVCVGEATKLVPFLMAAEKTYQAEALFGITTDTLDADGEVKEIRDASHLTRDAVAAALGEFVGVIYQRPPMHSALRVDGRRLYELAREGKEVEREARPVEVHAAELSEFSAVAGRVTARVVVQCGKGTYIRSLMADLGDRLGVGAHLIALRRTRVGAFTEAQAVPIERVGEGSLIALADALAGLPSIRLDELQARDIRDGKLSAVAALRPPEIASPYVRLLRADGTLLAVAESDAGNLRLARVFS
jgi:tRNA pseudouridine55 synthase